MGQISVTGSTNAKRVYIADSFTDDALNALKRSPAIEVDYRPDLSPEEKLAAIALADAIVVRSATKVKGELLEAGDRLELIVRAGVGVDNIDVEAATRRGVVVQNVPEGNTRSAAEHAVALILALARNVAQASASMKEGLWERKKFMGVEVRGKVLGVVGLGRIGRQVVDLASGLGFHVLAFDPFVAPAMAEQLGVELVERLEDLASRVDFMTVHAPLLPETRGLIGEKVLAGARPGLRLVNCARGGIVDEVALLKALEKGTVSGAALDVFEEEPPGLTDLIRHPAVITTPHLGASTREAQQNVALGAAELVVDYFVHRKLHSAVNAVHLDPDLRDDVQPYRELSVKLGRLQAQLLEDNPERVVVKYYGKLFTDRIQSYLTSSVLEGFIAGRSARPVNFINARALAMDQGLAVEERSEGQSRYFVNMIRVEISGGGWSREVGGTIRGRAGLRLVSLDRHQFDAVLEGSLVLTKNEDRPGMIGTIGGALGAKNVNVSYMSLGRDVSGGTAVAVLNTDGPVGQDVIEELASNPGILWVKAVTVD